VASVVKRGFDEEIFYLVFLFFGTLRENLSLYTLRDLQIREVRPGKKVHRARFASR
jgi:hypothetical protein